MLIVCIFLIIFIFFSLLQILSAQKNAKKKASLFISDSIFGRIKLFNAKKAQRFRRIDSGNDSAPVFQQLQFAQFVGCRCDIDQDVDVYQFVFGGWKASDGLTEQMKEIIEDASSGTNVTKIFLSVGINDFRFVF